MNVPLKPIPILHDLALEAGAHWDKADPNLGIMQDRYVFRLGELRKFLRLATENHADNILRQQSC